MLVGDVGDLYTLFDEHGGKLVKIKYVMDEVGVQHQRSERH